MYSRGTPGIVRRSRPTAMGRVSFRWFDDPGKDRLAIALGCHQARQGRWREFLRLRFASCPKTARSATRLDSSGERARTRARLSAARPPALSCDQPSRWGMIVAQNPVPASRPGLALPSPGWAGPTGLAPGDRPRAQLGCRARGLATAGRGIGVRDGLRGWLTIAQAARICPYSAIRPRDGPVGGSSGSAASGGQISGVGVATVSVAETKEAQVRRPGPQTGWIRGSTSCWALGC